MHEKGVLEQIAKVWAEFDMAGTTMTLWMKVQWIFILFLPIASNLIRRNELLQLKERFIVLELCTFMFQLANHHTVTSIVPGLQRCPALPHDTSNVSE